MFDKETDEKMPRLHVVFGAYKGPIDAKPGEKVVFIGDCAHWEGEIHGKPIEIKNVYKDRATHDPHKAQHDDIFAKLARPGPRRIARRRIETRSCRGAPTPLRGRSDSHRAASR